MTYQLANASKPVPQYHFCGQGFQDCLTVSIDYKRDPNGDRDIKTIDEIQLILNFKYLGSISKNQIQSVSGSDSKG